MKKTIYMLLGLLLAAGLTSCQDWFIEKPEVTGMDQDEVFSTAKNAEGAIAEAYATILSSGLPVLVWNNSPIMPYETTEAIMGGEDLCRLTWGYMDKQVVAGMLANNENNGAGYTDAISPTTTPTSARRGSCTRTSTRSPICPTATKPSSRPKCRCWWLSAT